MADGKCDFCGCELPKGRRRFCSNKHKDQYHNIHNPRGYYAPEKKQDRVARASSDEHSGLLRMIKMKLAQPNPDDRDYIPEDCEFSTDYI